MGWTSSRLALAVGLHTSVVSRTLRGETRSAASQLLIARFLGLAPKDLFGVACNPSISDEPATPRRRKGGTRAA